MVDEKDQLLAGDALRVGGPVPPLEFLRDDGLVAVADEFEFLVFVVEDFQEEQPAELLQPLGIARDAAVLPHDVADVFDDGGDVGHSVLGSGCFVEFVGQRMDGSVIGGLAAEGADDFHRRAELAERVEPDDLRVFQIEHAVVRILVEQGGDHLAGEVAVLGEVIALSSPAQRVPCG